MAEPKKPQAPKTKAKPAAKTISQPATISTDQFQLNAPHGTDQRDTGDTAGHVEHDQTQQKDRFQQDKHTPGENDGTDDQRGITTPQSAQNTGSQDTGEIPLAVADPGAVHSENQPAILVALARDGESRAACWERLRKEARSVGKARGQGPGTAYEWATRETERLFPPPEPAITADEIPSEPVAIDEIPEETVVSEEPAVEVAPPIPAVDQGVIGLGDLPADWPRLPANASLQAEIAWVSANRLLVRSGSGVDLSQALSPAPSYSALSWLETSILFPAKFADISVKATASQDDEREHIRREKLAIEEIRGLLAEMLVD